MDCLWILVEVQLAFEVNWSLVHYLCGIEKSGKIQWNTFLLNLQKNLTVYILWFVDTVLEYKSIILLFFGISNWFYDEKNEKNEKSKYLSHVPLLIKDHHCQRVPYVEATTFPDTLSTICYQPWLALTRCHFVNNVSICTSIQQIMFCQISCYCP